MKLWEMLVEDYRGNISHQTQYRYLFHMAKVEEFTFAVANNAIKGRTQSYISTTWNRHSWIVVNVWNKNFRFILDGPKLAKNYGVFPYTFEFIESMTGRSSKQIQDENSEDEIGIDTPSISPLTDYLQGLQVTWDDLFEENFILFMLRKEQAGWPINAMLTLINKWNIPLRIGKKMRRPRTDELELIQFLGNLNQNGYNTHTRESENIVYDKVVDKFDKLIGSSLRTSGRTVDRESLSRRKHMSQIEAMYTGYLQSDKISNLDENKIQHITEVALGMLGIGHNLRVSLIQYMKEKDMFSPVLAPVDWSSFYSSVLDEHPDEWFHMIDFLTDRSKHWIARHKFEKENKVQGSYGNHVGTVFPYT